MPRGRETKDLRAEVVVADDLPEHLLGDPVRLRAALENLIDNAVKFTAQGAVRLEVSAAPRARRRTKLICAVSDSGIGLKPAEINRLFRPFAQANADIARRYGGAGLGLAVVKAIAKLMGGDLTVTSTPGRGSRFNSRRLLAVAPAGAAGDCARAPRAPRRRGALRSSAPRTILMAASSSTRSSPSSATAPISSSSGEEAVAAVTRGYDAMLMDVTLPGIDGLEATRRIRAIAGLPEQTPIIGISGRSEAGDEQAARAAGMNFICANR